MKVTNQAILVVDSSEAVRSVIKWTLGQTFSVFEKTDLSTPIDDPTQYGIILTDTSFAAEVVDQLLPCEPKPAIIIMMNPDQCASALLTSYPISVDYLLKPFDEFTLRHRIEKNKRKTLAKVVVFDPSNTITAHQHATLLGMGFEISSTDRDQSLQTAIDTDQPDIILVDTAIPPLNRDRVIAQLNACQIPWIALLDPATPPQHITLWISAATDFVSKPMSLSELVFRMQRHISTPPHYQPKIQAPQTVEPVTATPTAARSTHEKALLDQIYVTLHHEIKSPLTGILIGAQALEKRIAPEQRGVAHEIVQSALRIKNTLDRLAAAESVSATPYVNDTQMATFELPKTPTFNWI